MVLLFWGISLKASDFFSFSNLECINAGLNMHKKMHICSHTTVNNNVFALLAILIYNFHPQHLRNTEAIERSESNIRKKWYRREGHSMLRFTLVYLKAGIAFYFTGWFKEKKKL